MQELIYYQQLDSTNRLAKELAHQGAVAGTVVQAKRQSAGRGQYERSFLSPPGGLYFSLILHPTLSAQEIALVTLAAGLGCRDAIQAQCGLAPQIKWPNDLYCSGKKIAGILSEYCLEMADSGKTPAVVVGVGMNVNSRSTDFPAELQGQLSTLLDCCGKRQDMAALLQACVESIGWRVEQLTNSRSVFLTQWRQADYLFGRKVQHLLRDEQLALGIGQGIDEQGRYLLLDSGQLRRILGGQLRPL